MVANVSGTPGMLESHHRYLRVRFLKDTGAMGNDHGTGKLSVGAPLALLAA
jgi:hypothetical protein